MCQSYRQFCRFSPGIMAYPIISVINNDPPEKLWFRKNYTDTSAYIYA
jgi:hypothetical protein